MSSIRHLIILAILLRILIMPFYFHPDIKTYHFQAAFLKQGVWDIYSYLVDNRQRLPIKEEFVYFPLTYYFLGGYQALISPLLGANFTNWLTDASSLAATLVGVYRSLFLLKLPYLILDIAIALLLAQFFVNFSDKKKAIIYWLFNPFWLILIYVFSNVDIIPVYVSLLSILFLAKEKFLYSGILLGISAGFKAYPLIFLPFLMLYAKNIKQLLLLSISSLVTLFLIILPFWSESFKQSALLSGLTTRIFLSNLSIGFGEVLLLPLISLTVLFFYGMMNQKKEKDLLWQFPLAVLLILFSTIHFHIQWLLWLAPFFTILVITRPSLRNLLFIVICLAFIIPLLYQDKSMTVSLLQTLSPLYNLLPTPFIVIQRLYDPYIIQSILHSFLVGGSLILIWQLFKKAKI